MRKNIILTLFVILVLLVIAAPGYSATKARTADLSTAVTAAYGLGDLSSGDTAEIDSDGNLQVEINDGTTTADVDADGSLMIEPDANSIKYCTENDLVVTGASVFYGIIVQGATAGDSVFVYDDVDASKDVTIAEVSISANTGTESVMIPGGVDCTNGIYVIGTDSDVDSSVIYDS